MLRMHRRLSSENESCPTDWSSAGDQMGLRGGLRLRARALRARALTPALGRGRSGGGRGGVRTDAAPATGNAAPFALGSPAPYAMLDVVLERVLEARPLHGALGAVPAGHLHPHPVAGEEDLGRQVPAPALCHPGSVQFDLRCARRTLPTVNASGLLKVRPWARSSQNPHKPAPGGLSPLCPGSTARDGVQLAL